jgi:hypothetical protein
MECSPELESFFTGIITPRPIIESDLPESMQLVFYQSIALHDLIHDVNIFIKAASMMPQWNPAWNSQKESFQTKIADIKTRIADQQTQVQYLL